jgi:hypothetical protein
MKPYLAIMLVGLLAAWNASAQGSGSVQAGASTQTQTSAQADREGVQTSGSESSSASSSASVNRGKDFVALANGTTIDAAMTNSIDAKKNKPGDRVEARTTQDVKQDGKVVLKRGTTLVGHVTEAKAHTKEQGESQLGIVFDHAVLKGGQEVPFNASIQALAAAQSSTTSAIGSDEALGSSAGAVGGASGSARGGGGLLGGVSSSAGGVVNTATSASGGAGGTVDAVAHSTTGSAHSVGGLTSAGHLASNSSGVFGMQGLSIDSAASSATRGSMIVSPTQNVHLGSGTQMLLNVTGQGR